MIQLSRDFKNFMNSKRFRQTDDYVPDTYTHVGLGNFRGKFYIPENEMKKFFDLYDNEIKRGVELGIAERPISHMKLPLVIDIDLKYKFHRRDEKKDIADLRRHQRKHVKAIIKIYHKTYLKYFDFSSEDSKNECNYIVMERKAPYRSTMGSKNIIKDGIHIMNPGLSTYPSIHKKIRLEIIENKRLHDVIKSLRNLNSVEDVFDEAVIDKNSWLLYGSSKPKKKPYETSYIYDFNMVKVDLVKFNSEIISMTRYLSYWRESSYVAPFNELGYNTLFLEQEVIESKFENKHQQKPIKRAPEILENSDENVPDDGEPVIQYTNDRLVKEKKEWLFCHYQDFMDKHFIYILKDTTNKIILPNAIMFNKYFKNVFAKVNNGGNSQWFAKSKKDGYIKWTILKDLPFNTASTKFLVRMPRMKANGALVSVSMYIQNYITREYTTIYNDVNFLPYLHKEDVKEKNILNLFTGFKFKTLPQEEKQEDDYFESIEIILNHVLKVLCNGNEKIYKYVIQWIAHLIQKPWDKSGVPCILMISDEGTGKNLFWDFMGEVLGSIYYIVINDLKAVTSKFNTRLQGKLLTCLNEIQNYGGKFKTNDKLKSILSDKKLIIEPKGKEAYEIDNYSRFVMLTNNDWPVRVGNGDRRYVAINCSDSKKGDRQYFNELASAVNDEANAKKFFQYVAKIDISEFCVRTIPETKLKNNLKWNNIENRPLQFLKEEIIEKYTDLDIKKVEDIDKMDNKPDIQEIFKSVDLFELYKSWCDTNNERNTYTTRKFTQQLKRYGFQYKRFRINKTQIRGFKITKESIEKVIKNFLKIKDYSINDEINEALFQE